MILAMSLLCACPPAAATQTIPDDVCIEDVGQIQRIAIVRLKNGTALNEMVVATEDPTLLATWVARKAAADSTKIQFTPMLQAPQQEPGEKREYGGGNQTLGGIPILKGRSHSTFEAELGRVKQSIIEVIKTYECEKNLAVYLINEEGNIIGLTEDHATNANFRPIPIKTFFCSDKKMGMFEDIDKNMLSFNFLPNWSDKLQIIKPAFDPLVEV